VSGCGVDNGVGDATVYELASDEFPTGLNQRAALTVIADHVDRWIKAHSIPLQRGLDRNYDPDGRIRALATELNKLTGVKVNAGDGAISLGPGHRYEENGEPEIIFEGENFRRFVTVGFTINRLGKVDRKSFVVRDRIGNVLPIAEN
jgi:hypothetical protein